MPTPQTVDPAQAGLDLARALQHLTQLEHDEKPGGRTLDEYIARTSHITVKADTWRAAAVYLACQYHSIKAMGDVARQQDAELALAHIREALAGFDRRHGGAA